MGSDVLVVGIFDGEGVDALRDGTDADAGVHLRGGRRLKKGKGNSGRAGKHGQHGKMGKPAKNGKYLNILATLMSQLMIHLPQTMPVHRLHL